MTDGLAFESILNFLSDLAEAFPDTSAARYHALVQEIKFSDRAGREQHIKLFSAFCIANRAEILENRLTELKMHKICFDDSEEPFDMQQIIDHKDFEANSVDILKHLLAISSLMDPESGAKQILISMEKTKMFQDPSVVNLFGNITREIEQKAAGSDLDPGDMIEGILQANSFKSLVNLIVKKTQNGDIDINNLLSGMSSIGQLMDTKKN